MVHCADPLGLAHSTFYYRLWQVVTATMPKLSADTLVANVNSGKLETLGGKTIEAVELSSGAVFYGHARRRCHGLGYDI